MQITRIIVVNALLAWGFGLGHPGGSLATAADWPKGGGANATSVNRIVRDLFIPAEKDSGPGTSGHAVNALVRGLPVSGGTFPPVKLCPSVLAGPGPAMHDRFRIAAPGGGAVTTMVDRLTLGIRETRTVRGRIDGSAFGHFLMSVQEGRCLAEVVVPEAGLHQVTLFSPGLVAYQPIGVVASLDMALEGGSPLEPPKEPSASVSAPAADSGLSDLGPDDGAVIDVMILYTPAARAWAESLGGIYLVIGQAMGRSELVMEGSETGISLRLVHAAEVAYVESGDSATDLRRLTYSRGHASDPEGAMDEVHGWRDASGADLVTLFAVLDDVGGRGWLLTDGHGMPRFGFNIVRVQQADTSYTTVHEMGHNLGAHHHKDQNTSPGPNFALNSYSAGWRGVGTDGIRYCSVMTYESGANFADGWNHLRIPLFSNPSLMHAGVSAGDPGSADNARTLRETKHAVAGYRPSSNAVHSVSGMVSLPAGTGLAGVRIHGLPGSPTTDAAGYYSTGVPDRWSGTAIPTRIGYLFDPSRRVHSGVGGDLVQQDYAARVCEIGDAVDAVHLTFETGGAGGWHCQDDVTHDGSDAARSGAISHHQESWVETSVFGPGRVEFMWKVSSEAGFDFLECHLNGARLDGRISGEVEWRHQQVTFGAGTHTVRWRYVKDGSIEHGEDAGWLDRVQFTATPATVVGRHVFYNHSAWDSFDAAANAADDMAIAVDKVPLLPGGTGTFANYTSYSKGLNGM